MCRLKGIMHELEMERYLKDSDHDIFDKEGATDSTKVIEEASLLGYKSELNDEEEFLIFHKVY